MDIDWVRWDECEEWRQIIKPALQAERLRALEAASDEQDELARNSMLGVARVLKSVIDMPGENIRRLHDEREHAQIEELKHARRSGFTWFRPLRGRRTSGAAG